jgi:hypothetical protein
MNTYRESTYRVLTGLLRVSLIVSMVIALTFSAAAGIPLGVKPAYAATIIVTNANDSGATSHTQTRADLPPAAPTAATPCDTNVAETSQYSVVYQMNIPANADYNTGSPAYSIDNTATTPAFDRVGYCLQLDGNWVWVSMDAFTTVPGRIGVPVASTGATFQQTVTNMNVASNVAGVTTGTGITTGNIEFWHHCYATGPVLGLPGNNSGLYDFDDNPGGQADSCYGSMQVHNYGAGQTIFAWNSWDYAPNPDDVGIGNNSGTHPDWTFQANTGSYTTRVLTVYARPTAVVPGAAGGNGPGGVGYIDPASSLQVWLRADRGVYTDAGCSTTPAVNGNNVRCWQDQSGKNRNATQNTAANQPVYQTSVINGQPSVRFGGATDDDYLNIDFNTTTTFRITTTF